MKNCKLASSTIYKYLYLPLSQIVLTDQFHDHLNGTNHIACPHMNTEGNLQ
jgi:hypothetical protein